MRDSQNGLLGIVRLQHGQSVDGTCIFISIIGTDICMQLNLTRPELQRILPIGLLLATLFNLGMALLLLLLLFTTPLNPISK